MSLRPPTVLETPCLLWPGALTPAGYGTTHIGERGARIKVYVHRLTWEAAHGPIPSGLQIMHRCDNPPCYRLDHLRAGTQVDNLRDMFEKGRASTGKKPKRTTCRNGGHPIVQSPSGRRWCKTCSHERNRARYRALASQRRNQAA